MDTTNRFEGTPEWDSRDVPGWPTYGREDQKETRNDNQPREVMSPEALLRLSERLSESMIPSSSDLLRISEQLTNYMSQ